MRTVFVEPRAKYHQRMSVVADKSVTQRAIIFHAVAKGSAKILHANLGLDCMAALDCVKKLGARACIEGDTIYIEGGELLIDQSLSVQNSATAARLLCGLLAGTSSATISGDASLNRRPMGRIIEPLRLMGANIESKDGCCPLKIYKASLTAIDYTMPIASAQVKSAIMLAALNAEGCTRILQAAPSRNHTEIMLAKMGADIRQEGEAIFIKKSRLKACDVEVLGDFSAAAYYLAQALIINDGCVTVERVGVNPTRCGFLDYIEHEIDNTVSICGERACDITTKSGKIEPFEVKRQHIGRVIDELALLAVLACFARGDSIIHGAGELRHKESDRLGATKDLILAMGGNALIEGDDLIIRGNGQLEGGATIDCKLDHRMAMTAAVAARASKNGATLTNCAVEVSDPNFFELI